MLILPKLKAKSKQIKYIKDKQTKEKAKVRTLYTKAYLENSLKRNFHLIFLKGGISHSLQKTWYKWMLVIFTLR